jgi:hypothetical protein
MWYQTTRARCEHGLGWTLTLRSVDSHHYTQSTTAVSLHFVSGDLWVFGGEECDGGDGCNEDCTCDLSNGYTPSVDENVNCRECKVEAAVNRDIVSVRVALRT